MEGPTASLACRTSGHLTSAPTRRHTHLIAASRCAGAVRRRPPLTILLPRLRRRLPTSLPPRRPRRRPLTIPLPQRRHRLRILSLLPRFRRRSQLGIGLYYPRRLLVGEEPEDLVGILNFRRRQSTEHRLPLDLALRRHRTPRIIRLRLPTRATILLPHHMLLLPPATAQRHTNPHRRPRLPHHRHITLLHLFHFTLRSPSLHRSLIIPHLHRCRRHLYILLQRNSRGNHLLPHPNPRRRLHRFILLLPSSTILRRLRLCLSTLHPPRSTIRLRHRQHLG